MPKVNLAKKAKRDVPPIDWLHAAVLERKMRYGFDLKYLAEVAGVSYDTMRRYITQSPWDWSEDARNRVCKELDLRAIKTVRFDPPRESEMAE